MHSSFDSVQPGPPAFREIQIGLHQKDPTAKDFFFFFFACVCDLDSDNSLKHRNADFIYFFFF